MTRPRERAARPGPGRPLRSSRTSRAAAFAPASQGWRARLARARSDRRMTSLAALFAVGVALMVLVGPTLRAYVTQQQQISALRQEVVEQEQAVRDLQAEQAKWEDPAYVEQQARQRLKFVKVGEKSYTVLDPQTGGIEVPGMAKGSSSGAWYASVWASIQAADAPAAVVP